MAIVVLHDLIPLPAETPPVSVQAKRQAQERARAMARELVTGVLDVQLVKLEVNGLDKLPLYTEIASMRKNIDRVIGTDMGQVIDLLAQAQELPEAERQKVIEVIRDKTRGIVVRLSIERQNLLRRLKLADLAAQIRRLIDLQSANLRKTEELTAAQTAQTLATIQDERDLRVLFGQLHNLVGDVSTWGGPEGAAAADGLRILKAAQVSEEIDRAIASLEAVKFPGAAASEKAVIKGLSALLEKIDEARGLANSDIEALLKEVAALTKRQQDLKQKTKAENLNDKTADALLQQQSKLHKDLDRLDEGLQRIAGTEMPLRKAKASAYEATANLFAAKQAEAVTEQDKVLTNLAAITDQLKKAANQANTAKSAEELKRLAEHLQKAKEALKESEPHQQKAFDRNAANPTVKDNLAEISKKLEMAHSEPELPSQVSVRLKEAKDAVQRAQEKTEPEAIKAAKDAVDRATAEVNAATAEAERRHLAVKIGELGRAAEALERAAAHQRDLSEKATVAAKKDGFTPAEAKELHKEQQEVAKVAANTAEGVKQMAPKAAEKLAGAAEPIQKTEAELASAKQTPKAADTVAKEAHKAAKTLEEAAGQLRSEIKETAKDLVKVADQELTQLGDVAKDVDKTRADVPSADKDKLEDLGKARKMIAEARTEQQRALGQEKAAKQRELARKIADALEQQGRADQAAKDLTEGKTARTIDATVAQQKAADQAGELAKQAKDKTGETLGKAEKAAAKAAKDLLDGKPHQAEAARKEARSALEKALQDARAQAEKTAAEEEGKPNAAAQKRVSDLSREAAQMAKEDAPAAAKHLDKAGEQSQEAEKKLAAAEKPRDAQKNAEAALREAEQQIDKAMKDLAQRQLDQKETKGEQIARAADKSAKVDPDALAALRSAEKNAKRKEDAAKTAPHETPKTPPSVKAMRRDLDQAATALDTRKAQAERDKALAEEVGRDATAQQQARGQIDTNKNELAKTEDKSKSTDPKDQPKNAKAANDLAKAMNQFAAAQQKIGENAKEISKQAEVANKPLLKAMEAASNLTMPQDGEAMNNPTLSPDAKTPEQAKTGTDKGKTEAKAGTDKGKQQAKAGQQKNAAMGTGLVPSSPQQTAEMIAGPQAAAQANQGQPSASASGSPANSTSQSSTQGSQSASSSTTGNNAPNASQGNQGSNTPGTGGADTTAKAKPSQEEPWMAKLPPELRKAMKANAQQRPPRGYEELLRRYFQRDE
jgi:hypothetical protein